MPGRWVIAMIACRQISTRRASRHALGRGVRDLRRAMVWSFLSFWRPCALRGGDSGGGGRARWKMWPRELGGDRHAAAAAAAVVFA